MKAKKKNLENLISLSTPASIVERKATLQLSARKLRKKRNRPSSQRKEAGQTHQNQKMKSTMP